MINIKPVFAADKVAGPSASLDAVESTENMDSFVDRFVKIKVITEVLTKYNSPLLGEVDGFMEACEKNDIDCYLLPSITGLESSFGRFTYPSSHNPFGWGGGYIMFSSWSEGFDKVGYGLKKNYIGRGATTIEQIGPIYAESPTWAQRVRHFHSEFEKVEAENNTYFRRLALEI